eukprot:348256-Hanusia_phi.AAC.1
MARKRAGERARRGGRGPGDRGRGRRRRGRAGHWAGSRDPNSELATEGTGARLQTEAQNRASKKPQRLSLWQDDCFALTEG